VQIRNKPKSCCSVVRATLSHEYRITSGSAAEHESQSYIDSELSSTREYTGIRTTAMDPRLLMEPPLQQRPLESQQHMIVTSCEEEEEEEYDDAQDSVSCSVDSIVRADDLFDDQADEEDEAYVYKHLRSGGASMVDTTEGSFDVKPADRKALKPRKSDAVLSCPGCFRIVCMDCQRHEYYKNQYRAMFVMSVMVRWDLTLQYDPGNRCLVPCSSSSREWTVNAVSSNDDGNLICSNEQVHNGVPSSGNDDDAIYYTVCCANCHTTVAALDMTDEVYYFSGCLASS
jgi:hypothetical protein